VTKQSIEVVLINGCAYGRDLPVGVPAGASLECLLQGFGAPVGEFAPRIRAAAAHDQLTDATYASSADDAARFEFRLERGPPDHELHFLSLTRTPCPEEAIAEFSRQLNVKSLPDGLMNGETLLLRAIVSGIPDLLYLYDAQAQRNLYTNNRIEEILGYTSEEVLAMGTELWPMLMHPDDFEVVNVTAREHQTPFGSDVFDTHYRLRHKNGEYRHIHSRDVIIGRTPSGAAHYLVGIAQDVTEAIRAREQLKTYAEQMQQARLRAETASQAKSVFLANMSHEIRTPLNAIMGTLSLMTRDHQASTFRDEIRAMQQAGERLLRMLTELMELSQIEFDQGNRTAAPVELRELVHRLAELLHDRMARRNVRLVLNLPEGPVWVMLDELRLKQALGNLLMNAVTSTENGDVTVSLSVHCESPEGCPVRISVADSGVGFEHGVEHLYDWFVHASGPYTPNAYAAGLSLVISKRLVELMGGDLLLENRPGEGATFTIALTIPCVEAPTHTPPTHLASLPSARVLVAEDDPVNRKVVVRMLQELGQIPEIAVNGTEALLKAESLPFDFILMDLRMPGYSGVEVADRIRKSLHSPNRTTPIVALTANTLDSDRLACAQVGMNDFLEKPITLTVLANTLTRHLA
jgi:hypothetical protein